MLRRFSLYGFLKNQRYFEGFFVLLLLDRGLSFFVIGLLVAFRDLTVNLLEIPSGAVADVWGRRRSLMLSFTAYIGSFVIFGLAERAIWFFPAMALYAVGDAFRTGTHKAIIFSWLRGQGRTDERVRVYGYTRSWSKFGSAASVILAGLFVLASDSYAFLFHVSVIPYLLGLINFMGYPADLDRQPGGAGSPVRILRHMTRALKNSLGRAGLRRLVLESMGFEGLFHAVKDYLQPILLATAIVSLGAMETTAELTQTRQAALLITPVYFVLHLISALASRTAHRLRDRAGGDARAAHRLWAAAALNFAALLTAAYFEWSPILVLAFVALHALQNIWRPVLISRFDAQGSEAEGATLLSVESQARRAATMILAPLLGLAIDSVGQLEIGGQFWPVGAVGLIVATGFFLAPVPGGEPSDAKPPA